MDDIITGTKLKAKPRITAEEMTRRREALRRADAHNRIEGIVRGSDSDEIFEAFVRGEIDATEIVPHLEALLPR
jgi:hypothetical protein